MRSTQVIRNAFFALTVPVLLAATPLAAETVYGKMTMANGSICTVYLRREVADAQSGAGMLHDAMRAQLVTPDGRSVEQPIVLGEATWSTMKYTNPDPNLVGHVCRTMDTAARRIRQGDKDS